MPPVIDDESIGLNDYEQMCFAASETMSANIICLNEFNDILYAWVCSNAEHWYIEWFLFQFWMFFFLVKQKKSEEKKAIN